jgi:transposase
MEHYVGLDVSLKQTSICVVNQAGSIVREGVVDSDPEAIAAFVRSKAPGAVRIGLETGPTATWLWTELKQLGLPVICIDARHAKAVLKMQVNKSDRNDAASIARIMQTGWFKEVRVKDLDSHSVRALLASRARCWSRSSVISRTRSVPTNRRARCFRAACWCSTARRCRPRCASRLPRSHRAPMARCA